MAERSDWGRRGARAIPWLVLLAALTTTSVLDSSIGDAGHRRNNEEFGREVARIQSAIQNAVRRQVSVLQATAGAVAANPDLNRDQFAAFYRHLALGEDARNLQGVGLSLSRPWERRDELAAEAARRGVAPYSLRPSEPRPEADAVILLEPRSGRNGMAAGFDMHAETIRRQAINRARSTGRASMTSVVHLASDGDEIIPSFLLYLPVKDSEGVVYSAIHADRLFRDVFAGQPVGYGGHVGVKIWAGSPRYDHRVFDIDFTGKAPFQSRSEIRLPEVGQTFVVEVVASAEFAPRSTVRPYVYPLGALVSTLLFLLASSLIGSKEASEKRETEQSLLAEVGRYTSESTEFGDESIRAVALAVAQAFGAVCRVDLYDEEGILRTISTRTTGTDAIAALEKEYPRAQCDPLFRRAVETGRPQRAAAYETVDERHKSLVDALRAGPLLIVPFRLGERALGAITLVRSTGAEGFSAEQAALGEAIAGRVALAIDNARLYHDLERRVEERTRELEASNRELESFCYSVSHDLRTPLRSLDGFGRVLKEDYGDRIDDQGKDYLDRILAAAKRMDELITALLTLSRLTRREIVPTDVDVTAMIEDQMHDLDRDGRIALDIQPGLRVRADARMLAVLFDNLLSNAVKFSSRAANPEIVVGRSADGFVFVRDNGAGFDMAYANKLFQPFERLHSPREFPGHGIGLATVERIVRRHGGEVRAVGRPGEGATFSVKFPD